MKTGQIFVGCIVALIAVLSGVYDFFTARGKGPILSNTFLFLSKEERAKAEYQLVMVVFGCLSAIFAFLTLQIFTSWIWPYIPMGALVLFLLVFVIVEAVKTESRNKKRATRFTPSMQSLRLDRIGCAYWQRAAWANKTYRGRR